MRYAAAIGSMFLATAALGQEAQDPDGWRMAKWGMTEAQILAAFSGEAQRLESKSTTGGVLLGIPAYTIQSKDFAVTFAFDEKGGLNYVGLMQADKVNPGVLHKHLFDLLETLLVEKYGVPTTSKDEQVTTGMSSRKRVWRLPRTVITLNYTYSAGFQDVKFWDMVLLAYEPPSREADKL